MSNNDKSIVYSNRVLIGDWYDSMKLQEFKLSKFLNSMKSGEMMLAKYRRMMFSLNSPVALTQSASTIGFGATISLLAPHIKGNLEDGGSHFGVILAGRITISQLRYTQELTAGHQLVGLPTSAPRSRGAFVITSVDYCNREGELLKYNQEFLLTLEASTKNGRKPLYIRYDPDPFPGVSVDYQLYLSENPVSNTRWRILPVQQNNITRFEQEGKPVPVNTNIVINHCASNINLGISTTRSWMGFYRPMVVPEMKTCVDIYNCELPYNIWQIYIPLPVAK